MTRRIAIRALDVGVAGALLLVATPLLVLIAVAIRLGSPGPALFRQTRVGRDGHPFVLLKFRTMEAGTTGPCVTAANDARLTPLGRLLRRWKLDELPQLANVLRGDMSLVGPRPDVPEYLDRLPALDPAYRAARPGLTDPATLAYYDEEERLAAAGDPERHYLDVILPDKVRLSAAYQRERTVGSDLGVLWATVRRIVRGRATAAIVAAAWLALGGRAHAAGGVLVVAPHPDDEVLTAAGIMAAAGAAGRDVTVVVVTNGDYYGTDAGLVREGESVDALAIVGVPESAVVFLGYPDAGLLALWNNAPSAAGSYVSPWTGRQSTYAARGLGNVDFHTYLTGAPGPYNAATLVADLTAAIDRFRPADVYVTGVFDAHPDHRATYYAVRQALRALAATDRSFEPTLHTTIVHDPVSYPFDDFWPPGAAHEETFGTFDDDVWPNPALASGVPQRFDPQAPFAAPPSLPAAVLDWAMRESLPVPAAMAVADYDTNLKARAVRAYATEMSPRFVTIAHVKADEFFWPEVVRLGSLTTNLARVATATASSEAPGQGAAAAIDGIVDGAPANPGAEWVAARAGAAASLTLEWFAPVVLERIVLFDRVALDSHVTAGRVTLDDGTTIPLAPLANDGRGDELVLAPPHRVTRLTFSAEGVAGTAGLAEIEVFGALPPRPCSDAAGCDDRNPCTRDVCRDGFCAADPVPDGTACGDGDACNGSETCAAGACVRQPAPDCDDGDPCTRDHCVPPGGCVHDLVCQPTPVAGRAGCTLGFVGLPAAACVDGDPACDRDATTNGACRFDVILCANIPRAGRHACRAGRALAAVAIDGRAPALASLATRLEPLLPTANPTCVGPVPVTVALGTAHGRARTTRERVRVFAVTTRARLAARVRLACRPAAAGVVRRPPPPPGP